VPALAEAMGVGAVLVKDESSRLGLPAFKIAGASWAVQRALGGPPRPFAAWDSLDDLAASSRAATSARAATDGNHGRAVARMAPPPRPRRAHLRPSDMVPPASRPSSARAPRWSCVDGTYDEAVAASARTADARHVVVSAPRGRATRPSPAR
jgi:diaminopropionate ammonia-lyase